MNAIEDEKILQELVRQRQSRMNGAEIKNTDLLRKLESMRAARTKEKTGSGILEQAADMAKKYIIDPVEATRLPEFAGGLLQGVSSGVTSAANVPLMLASKISGREVRLPYPNLMQYGRQDPGSKAAFIGGELAGSLVPGTAAYKALQGALGKVANPSLLTEGLAGAGAGALVGGSEDERTRALGGALGAALPVAGSLFPKVIAGRIIKKGAEKEKEFQKKYGKIFQDIQQEGLSQVEIGDIPILSQGRTRNDLYSALKEKNMQDFRESLSRFEFEPTFENAHAAQSDLRKAANAVSKKIKTKKLKQEDVPKELTRQMSALQDARSQIKDQMDVFLDTMKKPEIREAYRRTTKGYAKEVGPYRDIPTYRYKEGKMYPMQFLQEALRNPRFTSPSGPSQQIPGMELYRIIGQNPLLAKALGGAAAVLGGGAAYELGVPGIARLINNLRG